MMRKLTRSGQFIRDLKKYTNRHKDISVLVKIVECLQANGSVDRKYKPHKLIGNWAGKMECHIEKDLLLIYAVNKNEVILYRIGSHSKLFSI